MKPRHGQLSFVGLATVAVALFVHGCQSPEGFHLTTPDADDSSGTGGEDSGSGGVGNGTSGASRGTGGQGSGGVSGTGGVAVGTGGHATGGIGGPGGRAATGGIDTVGLGGHGGTTRGTGSIGRGGSGVIGQGGRGGRVGTGAVGGRGGRSGAGGRNPFGFSDSNCVTDLQANGYTYGTTPGCSACNDNGTSLEAKCQAVIDCMAPQWPCSGNCATQCYNMAGASGLVMSCVSALTTAACGM